MSHTPFTQPPARRDTRIRLIAGGAIGLVAIVGLFLLFSGSSEETAAPPPAVAESETIQHVDGTLTVVENERLVLKPFDGAPDEEMEFTISDPDLPNFDIAHMQSHSSVALPTRIYYEREGDRLMAKYKEDAPVNSQQSP